MTSSGPCCCTGLNNAADDASRVSFVLRGKCETVNLVSDTDDDAADPIPLVEGSSVCEPSSHGNTYTGEWDGDTLTVTRTEDGYDTVWQGRQTDKPFDFMVRIVSGQHHPGASDFCVSHDECFRVPVNCLNSRQVKHTDLEFTGTTSQRQAFQSNYGNHIQQVTLSGSASSTTYDHIYFDAPITMTSEDLGDGTEYRYGQTTVCGEVVKFEEIYTTATGTAQGLINDVVCYNGTSSSWFAGTASIVYDQSSSTNYYWLGQLARGEWRNALPQQLWNFPSSVLYELSDLSICEAYNYYAGEMSELAIDFSVEVSPGEVVPMDGGSWNQPTLQQPASDAWLAHLATIGFSGSGFEVDGSYFGKGLTTTSVTYPEDCSNIPGRDTWGYPANSGQYPQFNAGANPQSWTELLGTYFPDTRAYGFESFDPRPNGNLHHSKLVGCSSVRTGRMGITGTSGVSSSLLVRSESNLTLPIRTYTAPGTPSHDGGAIAPSGHFANCANGTPVWDPIDNGVIPDCGTEGTWTVTENYA